MAGAGKSVNPTLSLRYFDFVVCSNTYPHKGEFMSKAKTGDTVRVHYVGKLEDDTIFDTSEDREPLEFTIGDGNIIPGFENGVVGMEAGEQKTITLPPEEAYGEWREELTVQVGIDQFSDNIDPVEGMPLQLKQRDGNLISVVVAEVADQTVTLDANPPLAGKTLVFDLELVAIL